MSDGLHGSPRAALRRELGALRGDWPWFVALGIALVALGAIALGSVVVASLATAVAIGVLLLAGGVAEGVGAFWSRGWSGVFLHLLSAVLSVVVGVMFLQAPVDALVALTMLAACFLIVGGTFKVVAAASYQFAAWGWPLVGGLIDVVLGVMIWRQLPASALWVVGLFLGVNLVFRGFAWVGLGLALRGHATRATAPIGPVPGPYAAAAS